MNEVSSAASSASAQHEPVVLQYEALDPCSRRPRWVYAVAVLYLLLLVVFFTLPVWAGWMFNGDRHDITLLEVCVSIFAGCGLSLMLIPVQSVRRRPIARRSIWFPVIGSGLLGGVLVLGGGFATCEYVKATSILDAWIVVVAGLVVWTVWSLVFALIAFSGKLQTVGMTLHRWLIAGSVLELLVAVPAHVMVRRRTECFAGIWTGVGICLGVAVMLISFGPSVLLLYHRRRKQITRPSPCPHS